jgi:hypothetical protein
MLSKVVGIMCCISGGNERLANHQPTTKMTRHALDSAADVDGWPDNGEI